MTSDKREVHVVVQERTGLFRKAGGTFLTIAVIVASITILMVVFAGEAPEELLIASLILAGVGIGLAAIDWTLRLARDGVRSLWDRNRAARHDRRDRAAREERIHALEAELAALRAQDAESVDPVDPEIPGRAAP